MSIQTSIIQIERSGIARVLAPIVMPAREIFREPADMLSVQQADWAPALADRIGSLIAPGWAASQYVNDLFTLLKGAAERIGITNIFEQVMNLIPNVLRQGMEITAQLVSAVLRTVPIVGDLIGMLLNWIVDLFRGGPTQEEWDVFRAAFISLKELITGFEIYATEAVALQARFERVVNPNFSLAAMSSRNLMIFEHRTNKPRPHPEMDDAAIRLETYIFKNYRVAVPGVIGAATSAFIPFGYSLVFPKRVSQRAATGNFLPLSLRDMVRQALVYPIVGVEKFVTIDWWAELWENTSRREALDKTILNFPENASDLEWGLLQSAVNDMSKWAPDEARRMRGTIVRDVRDRAEKAQPIVQDGLASALNNLGDAEAMFVHTPDETQVYRSRDGSAPYPGRKLVIVPRGSQRPPENSVALHWTSRNFDLYRGAAADNIIRGANRAAAQSARKTGDGRGGAALLALAAAGVLIYANSRN